MTWDHAETGYSLLEKPSSFYKEAYIRNILTAFLLLLMFLVNGCKPMCSLGLPHPPGFLSTYDHGRHGNQTFKIRRSIADSQQCLVLDDCGIKRVCIQPINQFSKIRFITLRELRLNFCGSYRLPFVISEENMHGNIHSSNCTKFLQSIKEKDDTAQRMYQTFMDVLNKFDCTRTPYSVKWSCAECQTAYRNWLCSTHIEYFHPKFQNGSTPLPVCTEFCTEVEKKCPFFRPETFEAQAGEPSFICKDRDIDKTNRLSDCLKECHLRENDSCEFVFSSGQKTTTTAVLTGSYSTTDSTSSNTTSQSSGTPSLHPHQFYSILNIVLHFLSIWMVKTLLQYMTLGWT